MEYKDYYKTLGINKSATDKEIKSAYRKLAKKYHPDLNQGDQAAQEKFKEIGEAYEVLSDPEKKRLYDQFGTTGNFTGGSNFDPSQYGYTYTTTGGDYSDFFETFFGEGSRGQGGFDFADFINSRTGRKRKERRQSYETDLSISISDAYHGTERNVSLEIGGYGIDVPVKVPAGITEGKKIKVKGEKFGVSGDILFKIHIMDGVNMTLNGLDITKVENIYPWQAALGDKIVVSTPSGRIKVNVPEGMRGGTKLRVPKKGFKDMKGRVGDMYVEFNLMNPEDLTERERELYQELRALRENL